MFLGSKDMSHEAEKVSGPQDMLEKGIFEAERMTYSAFPFPCLGSLV